MMGCAQEQFLIPLQASHAQLGEQRHDAELVVDLVAGQGSEHLGDVALAIGELRLDSGLALQYLAHMIRPGLLHRLKVSTSKRSMRPGTSFNA